MWEGADDEWLVFDGDGGSPRNDAAEQSDPVLRGKESAENDDVE